MAAAAHGQPQALRGNPVWVYWLGRALKAQGRAEEAYRLFASIADQVHFYGQLAQEDTATEYAKLGVSVRWSGRLRDSRPQ